MGNRAVITTSAGIKNPETNIGIYVHWNGGIESIMPFVTYCKLKGYRCPDTDCYGWAYLTTVIGNYFGSGLSLGVDTVACLDTNGDNGTWVIDEWRISEHYGCIWDKKNEKYIFQKDDDFEGICTLNLTETMNRLIELDQCMPEEAQLHLLELSKYEFIDKLKQCNLDIDENKDIVTWITGDIPF